MWNSLLIQTGDGIPDNIVNSDIDLTFIFLTIFGFVILFVCIIFCINLVLKHLSKNNNNSEE